MAGMDDTRSEIAGAMYEAEVLSATIVVAVEALKNLPEGGAITPQLDVVLKLARQLDDMVDRLAGLLREHFAPATQ
jgi:hypothetical protein